MLSLSNLEEQILYHLGEPKNCFGLGVSELADLLRKRKEVISRNCAKLRKKGLIQHRSEAFSADDFALLKKKFRSFTLLRTASRSRDPYVWTDPMHHLWTAARISRALFRAAVEDGGLERVLWHHLLTTYQTQLFKHLIDKGYDQYDAERTARDAQLRISSANFQTDGREILTL
jgi:hypothetical protein